MTRSRALNAAPHAVALSLVLSGAGCALEVDDPRLAPTRLETAAASPTWAEGIPVSSAFRARQAEYLSFCAASNGPGQGNAYGQLCRLAADAGPLDEAPIRAGLEMMNNREDTADFRANAIIRMLALYGDHPALDPVLKAEMVDAVLNFKYWLDEPGPDMMCWWSENHQILFHTVELVAGQLFPDTLFPNSGMTGTQHVAHAIPLIHEWLDRRGMFGFSEWHSNVYFNEDMPALLNLVELAQDPAIATKAAMVVDIMAFDMANAYFKGVFGTAHGRTYERTKVGGTDDDIGEAAWILLGQGDYRDTGSFSGSFLVSSQRYWPPAILEDIVLDSADGLESKQRDGIDVAEGPDWGIGYEDFEDIMFWWGMTGYVASPVIEGTIALVDYYDLWDNYFWSDLAFLEPVLVGADWLEPAAETLDDFTRGPALEAMSAYTWRTADYQLSGAQDYNPGMWAAQQHIWQATLDRNAVVFTTAPGGMDDDYMAGAWTGGWLPRALFHQNVGVIQYDRRRYPVANKVFFDEYTHAYFPRKEFDEVVGDEHWTFGRKGDAYIALYSHNPVAWAAEEPQRGYELIADGLSNVWIVELGSRSESGDFTDFMAEISATTVWVSGPYIEYESPSQGLVATSATGPLVVGGNIADTGPYERFENRYAQQPFGSNKTVITHAGNQLELDFSGPTRRYTSATTR